MTPMFDARQIRRAFGRAAHSYAGAADLQREVEAWLLESLMYLDDSVPATVVDLGSGPGRAAAAMQARWPKARVLALDLALPMLRQAQPRRGWLRALGGRRAVLPICADAAALPLADASVDVLFSNLCLQWVEDLPAALAGFRRVLRPGGLLLCSSFGHDTLHELRAAFAEADRAPHVSPFATIAQFGDALMQAGFRDPVLEREPMRRGYPDLAALMRELRALGATNALAGRRRSLTGRARFARAAAAYEPLRDADGRLPATWEVITAMAWAPAPGAPIRERGTEIASFPADRIPLRKRR
ncbi:malonyl-ACP O-methyltransferase BioC [Luteimonas sp. RD2P54]|uniref:Malonyl-[acyl-carrier protein] O-methyltransferase n=1 Tax=Luteimonas endophytica TaxID=3042023 RepID=A0ABT6J4Q7_9GAMM|nr:malonyl-ACP O-methyltransferase BioC [Luteimonas endophytica]MDH5821808.1 malonyl-ACP O-methyltransferase BioC [Luteimonas endophytica]